MSKPAPLATMPAPNTFAADYPSLFGDQGIDLCPDEAFESRFGPFAYADSLLVTARRLEAKVGEPPESPLASRRRDIPDLLLDEPALNRRVPRLALAVEYLEAMVKSTDSGHGNAAVVLAAATSPANLPFDRAWALVAQVLRSKRQHPWQLLRQTDEDYPNFSHRTIVNASMRNALTLCTGLAPAQLRALQATQATSDRALWTRMGWPADSTVAGLADSVTFLSLTGLNRKRLRQLLAVNGVARSSDDVSHTSVTISKEGKPDEDPDSSTFGAHFVNDGQSPALRLVSGRETGKATRIENLTTGHIHRIDAMLRLHAGTGLPFAALDRLLQAIFAAQRLDDGFQIDVHALRALGLYCHLRDSRRVDLNAYAAVLHEISPYATGRDTSHYDTLFRPGAGSSDLAGSGALLTMDGKPFSKASSDPTMQRLCAGMAVGIDTLSTMVGWVTKARNIREPVRSLSFVSACHASSWCHAGLASTRREAWRCCVCSSRRSPPCLRSSPGKPSSPAVIQRMRRISSMRSSR
ncbi:Tc toxin subunit A [Luteibacter sp. dw_328]|uniref:Tc toxin subunit A n=1 Tax=Luteibacter sp. dw_328 TaxID=2719796 RepID=UPI001BD63D27|nr:Tc toxin subunit A [Luteibacter sp. dw_328]